MPEVYLFIFTVVLLAIVVFTIVGFINTVAWLFGSSKNSKGMGDSKQTIPPSVRPNLKDDLAASRRVIQHLRQKEQIDEATFDRLSRFLETQAASSIPEPDEKQAAALHTKTEAGMEPAPAVADAEPTEAQPADDVSVVSADEIEIIATVVTPEDEVKSPVAPLVTAEPSPAKPAPWDLPDPPSKPPRRSFAEMMSGFMEEKNMRWGELTSGILIVLSAVGLVVSLREELRNTIPYFPALLFMLITAAIHGSGIYTLKKWKLRNTSRGTLVIGLLLVPLNFLAACILSSGEERRALSDPWLWAAVGLGFSGFAAMTWWSSKFLLRRGHWPMVASIMGCGIGTLLVNRLAENANTQFQLLLLTLPIGVSFIIGTCLFERRQWIRSQWSERAVNRMFLFLGIGTFATFAALSLIVYRANSPWFGVVASTPVATLVCLVASWLGSIARRGATGKSGVSLRFSGLVIEVLGLILLTISLVISMSSPTMFVVNAGLATLGLVAMFLHQDNEKMLPVAWAVLSGGILAMQNLALGNFAFDQWCSFEQWKTAILSGQSGLCLLVVGLGVVGIHLSLGKRFVAKTDLKSFNAIGWITGGVIVLTGCGIALVASFVDRNNVFDAMTASVLLLLAAVGALSACLITGRRRNYGAVPHLPYVASILVLAGLAHSLIWNHSIGGAFEFWTGGIGASWITVAAVHGLIMAIMTWQTLDSSENKANEQAGTVFASWAMIASATVSVGLYFLIGLHAGWATFYMLVASLSFLFVGRGFFRGQGFQPGSPVSAPFVLSTGWLLVVAVADLGVRLAWIPDIDLPTHWLIQATGLAIWSAAWTVASLVFFRTNCCRWLTDSDLRVDQFVLAGVVMLVGAIVCFPLISGVGRELFENFQADGIYGLDEQLGWVYVALGSLCVALVFSIAERPQPFKGACLIFIWLLAWAFGATPFEASFSVGSAVRWLLPIGGVALAMLFAVRRLALPACVAGRNRLQFSGPSKWKNEPTQQLINFALAMVSVIVLLISTITTAQVLLNGVGSLGGPKSGSWFSQIAPEISYGIPIALIVGTFLMYAISEKRRWLAMAGSGVFQYVVAMAVVLLIASPHAKLASSWFLNILQVVSLGMTGYGFVWLWMRDRIEDTNGVKNDPNRLEPGPSGALPVNWVPPIELHTLINGVLITSLAVLVIGRFYLVPDQTGGWIGSVGSPLGLLAWATFGALALGVWWYRLSRIGSVSTWLWLVGWMGLTLVGLVAAVVDQQFGSPENFIPWLSYNVVSLGLVVVVVIQTCLLFLLGPASKPSRFQQFQALFGRKPGQGINGTTGAAGEQKTILSGGSADTSIGLIALPILLSSGIGLIFAVRGTWMNAGSFGLYVGCLLALTILIAFVGTVLRSSALGFVAVAIAGVGITVVRVSDPLNWFRESQPYGLNLMTIAMSILAIGWTSYYLYQRRSRHVAIKRSFSMMPNIVLLVGAIWIFAASIFQLLADSITAGDTSTLNNPLGILAAMSVAGLWGLAIWNDRARFRVIAGCLLSLALVIGLSSHFSSSDSWRLVGTNFWVAILVGVWGWVWVQRSRRFKTGKRLGVTRWVALERSIGRQLPVYSLIVTGVVILIAFSVIFSIDVRIQRYAAAAVPFALAFSFGCQSDADRKRWMQILCMSLVTLGGLFLAWADLSTDEMFSRSMLRPMVRCLMVLAGAMFVYGGLVARWVRPGDTWIRTLREMAVATCGLAVVCLSLVIINEASVFEKGIGCGLTIGEGTTIALLVTGMMVGLITIAVRPEHDPFALSLNGRMGYVYAAQFVGAALIAHLYFSMPFLFRFGIQKYWPFIAMALCFGGVGIAQVLEKRKLTVLAQPLFNVAAIMPILVAAGIIAIDTEADVSLVMLIIGMAYLMISYTHRSTLSGIGAIVFGNLALWLFIHRYPDFSFVQHPQMWLIPPAISVLIAGQLSRRSLTAAQLATIRYLCVAVIYVASTSEIFIDGIGDNLWPPVVLAILAVAGVLAGIILQVKSFLYFGILFLLMAMISMVAHAHQRLEHVWPWWAFGIGLGVAILVMFGIFEKRKNEVNRIANRMKEWDV